MKNPRFKGSSQMKKERESQNKSSFSIISKFTMVSDPGRPDFVVILRFLIMPTSLIQGSHKLWKLWKT